MSQRNFEEHVREQGGVFRRGTMSQRCGTGDMDAEGEEGEVRGWLSLTCFLLIVSREVAVTTVSKCV